MNALTTTADVDGRRWTIERVWPAEGSALSIEAHAGAEVRGGGIDASGAITLLPANADPALPALADVARAGRVISHRPSRRAVVRLDDGSGYAKVVAPGRARKVLRAHARGAVFSSSFAVPSVVDHVFPADQVVCFSAIPGVALSALGADAGVTSLDWSRAWSQWRDAWVRAVRQHPDAELPRHDLAAEAEVLRTWAAHGAEMLEGGRVQRTAERLIDALSHAASHESVSHRDLHDGQLLWSAQHGIGLIDLDTTAVADTGLDLGNLAAHADFAVRQGRWTAQRGQVAIDAVADAARALDVAPTHLAAWRDAALFRVACVNGLRPRWRDASRRTLHEMAERHD